LGERITPSDQRLILKSRLSEIEKTLFTKENILSLAKKEISQRLTSNCKIFQK